MTTTQTFSVTGLTCDHCVTAVRNEIGALHGVSEVRVVLDAGATSTVTVSASSVLTDDQIAEALDEAGPYALAQP
jgi:copper chaperone CopZ